MRQRDLDAFFTDLERRRKAGLLTELEIERLIQQAATDDVHAMIRRGARDASLVLGIVVISVLVISVLAMWLAVLR